MFFLGLIAVAVYFVSRDDKPKQALDIGKPSEKSSYNGDVLQPTSTAINPQHFTQQVAAAIQNPLTATLDRPPVQSNRQMAIAGSIGRSR